MARHRMSSSSNFNRTYYKQFGGPGQKPHSAASNLGLHSLPCSHKQDSRLILVKL